MTIICDMHLTMETKDKTKITIEDLLKSHTQGLTIQDIMNKTGLARHTVLARLHVLIGEGKVKVRQINMAKLHYWAEDSYPDEQELKEVLGKISDKIEKQRQETKVQPLKEEHIKISKIKEKPKTEPVETDFLRSQINKGWKGEDNEKLVGNPNQFTKQEVSPSGENSSLDMAAIKAQIAVELGQGRIKKHEAQIKEQRAPFAHYFTEGKHDGHRGADEFIKTGIPGFDELFNQGIPKGSNVLIAGGAGSGKTIFALQTVFDHIQHGDKCLYMMFEESESKLIHHMEDFGWDVHPYLNKGSLLIKRFNPFDITRSVDALLLEAKGELLIDIEPIIFPKGFNPDIVIVDSLTAIASAFTGKEDSYRIYIEQLFRFFEKIKTNTFLITETKQIPTIFSQSGVEEFLADGVIVLYNIKRGNVRESAIEVLKMRGTDHEKKIVSMKITDNGIVVYPKQEVFSEIESKE